MNVRGSLSAFALSSVFIASAQAYTIEWRIVERVGDINYVLPAGDTIVVRPNSIHRYRLQFRVVPDDENDALGGFLAWNIGTITTTGGINYRTSRPPDPAPRGRIAPFNAPNGPNSDGVPNTDPFTSLTQIDAAFTRQTPIWLCNGEGEPNPPPVPLVYGRGTFVSVHEITSVAQEQDYTITYTGGLWVAREWRSVVCNPPDCGDPADPSDDVPTTCEVAPFPYGRREMPAYVFHVHVCPAEWNDDRALDSQDLFDYFNDFFNNSGDFNGDGKTAPDDLYEYIDSFMNSCG